MSKPHSSKIFIRYNGELCDFMWANVGPDGTAMFCFVENGKHLIETIFDEKLGELRPGDFIEEKKLNNPKISFHPSGRYKLSTRVGLSSDSIDRCTIIGIPLKEISTPRRMMEVLLLGLLKKASTEPTKRDIVLDGTDFKKGPLRVTLTCLGDEALQILPSFVRVVNTSMCEFSDGLEFDSLIWLFTLRISERDHILPNHLRFFIPGIIKWSIET